MLLGTISGNVTTHDFSFDAEARVKKLQYLTVKDFEGRWILAYIDSIIKHGEITKANAKVIGSRDSRGFLKQIQVPFEPGTPVYTADESLIISTLGLKDSGLYIGLLTGYRIQVKLPAKHLLKKHVAILAKSGAGKSYAAGVLLEEFAEQKIPLIVIDPHGEYSSLAKKNEKEEELKLMKNFGIEPKSYRSQMNVFSLRDHNRIKLNARLTADEVVELLPTKLSSSQRGLLYSAVKELEGKEYTLRDIIEEVEDIDSNSKWGLISLLGLLESTGMFSTNPTKPEDLVKDGKVCIIDLKDGQPEIQQMVVMKLAKELFEARKFGKIPEFLMVIEEAHNFAPERGFGEVSSSKILRTIASEGRKFGMGLCFISQRPAKVDKNILSQASTQIILKVTNPNDVKAIMDSVEGVSYGTKEEIKDLPIGVAMVVGVTEQPLIVDIRIRRSEHGGESIKLEPRLEPIHPHPEMEATSATQEHGFESEHLPPQKKEEQVLHHKVEEFVSAVSPKVTQEEVFSHFKGIESISFLNYPMWRAAGMMAEKDVEFYVDGITGEVAFSRGGLVGFTHGMKEIIELPENEREVMLYLIGNRSASSQRISMELRISSAAAREALDTLTDKGFVIEQEGKSGRSFGINADPNIPEDTNTLSPGWAVADKEKRGNFLDPSVLPDFVIKAGEIMKIRVTEVKPVYFPYWVISHKEKRFLVSALDGRLEMEKSKLIRGML
jgi:hypothetical protein